MKTRILSLLLAVALLLSGCTALAQKKQYTATFLTLFDTVTMVVGLSESEEAFEQQAQDVYDALEVYHRLFDVYNSYDGLQNLKTVNDNAGVAPVRVDDAILSLLLDCRRYYDLTNGRVDVTMGSVLSLWHEARNAGIHDPVNARLPESEALEAAAQHTGWDSIEIDEQAKTVFILDGAQSLDVGAVAKGWAAQRVAENAPDGLLLSVGGNVCATGAKDGGNTPWVVGVNNPDGGEYLHTLNLTRGSIVTSGDYQRYYTVDGVIYHHIIDPDTLYPANEYRSVTVICADSGLADALSTALFLLPQEQGQEILDKCNAEALWVDHDGNEFYSTNFQTYVRT